MPFPFAYLCDLLEQITDSLRGGPKASQQLIKEWFQHHRALVTHENTNRCALLSCLLPELRTDRMYGIKEVKLEQVIARAWGLGTRRRHLTPSNKNDSPEDFADAVERTLIKAPNDPGRCSLSLETIDRVLENVASNCRFSSPAVRSLSSKAQAAENEEALREIYRQVTPREAKWLTRMILKDYRPVVLDEHVVYQSCHELLLYVMKIHDNFAEAMGLLQRYERNCGVTQETLSRELITTQIKPILGVKVGRQTFLKGRSARDCVEMGSGLMSCERKMDGEYCQIHVNVEKGMDRIQIFSKSRKDSTADRIGVHKAIKAALKIGEPSCKLKKGCILEGELLVYSDKEKRILGFDEIRKHVNRSGSSIGTEYDCRPSEHEHLMIVYYDALMIDDDSLLSARRSERFRRLENLIEKIPGQAELVKRRLIDFSSPTAVAQVQSEIDKCVDRHEEGFVLKADDPYFDFSSGRRRYSCCPIKCKPQYDPKRGEVGDFAVVGARYDPAKAKEYENKIADLKWTHFYLGCLLNKRDVLCRQEKPSFKIVAVVTLNITQLQHFARFCWTESTPVEDNDKITLQQERGVDNGKKPSIIFANPAVFDISSFSFHREAGTSFWAPRFPQVTRIHCDRTQDDCLTFSELQKKAESETSYVAYEDSQELVQRILRLGDDAREMRDTDDGNLGSQATNEEETRTPQEALLQMKSNSPHAVRGITGPEELPARGHSQQSFNIAPMTPPRSSLPEGRENEGDEILEITAKDFQSRKRSRPMNHDVPTKKQKRVGLGTPVSSSPIKPASQHRQPLGDITSSSQGSNVLPTTRSASQGIQESLACPLEDTEQAPLEVEQLLPSLPVDRMFPCHYAGNVCALANCLILLSPCLARFPFVAEDLPKSHGVTSIFTDLNSWRDAPLDHKTGDGLDVTPQRRKFKKIILVERNRRQATKQFLSKIEALNLQRHGRKQWVKVYDWRLLEYITQEEHRLHRAEIGTTRQTRATGAHKHEVWRTHLLGLI